jgi:DMSO/TMAO reductase YedYZ heme-binding membrane subunit
VPGRTPWRTTASALGIVAFWLAVLVTASFYARKLIGLRAWRIFHYTSFAIVVLGLAHGLLSGADTKNRVVQASYIACGLAVVVLTAVRASPRRRAELANRTAARIATIRVKVTGKHETLPEDGLPAPDPFVLPARLR